MPYLWPLANPDLVLDDALDIALDYLEFTGQAFPFSETQRLCAHIILQSWHSGTRHRIRLANDAINAIEKRQATIVQTQSLYPRVG